jgi:drug/metabolite transporter (DMT)-like permease
MHFAPGPGTMTDWPFLTDPMSLHLRGILILLVITLVWGTTFPAMKNLTAWYSPTAIILARFALASLLLAPFLFKARRSDLASGAMLGVVLFACYIFQVEGLALTSSNRNAFICGLNVLVVPLLGVAGGRKLERRIVAALLLSLTGLAALCWDGGAWSVGDSLALACAFCFGAYITMMESRTRGATSLMVLSAMQILTVALCALAWLLLREPQFDWPHAVQGLGQHGWNLAFLGVVATAAIISLQSWAQRHTSANEAAVIYAFEPASAAFFAYFWLGETMTMRGWLGAALLISGMIVSQWNTAGRPPASLAPE